MYIAHMNHLEVSEYLKNRDTVLIPVGSLENHGLHMPLGTDFLIPDKIAALINEKSPILIAPTLNYGATDDLNGFPGTVSIGTEGLIQLLKAICDGLYQYGFRHFLILNGHGGNTAAIQAVGMHLYRKGAYLANLNWWLMAWDLNPAWKGGHGGAEETAGVLAVDPSLVDWDALDEMNLHNDVTENIKRTNFKTVEYKGVPIVICRKVTRFTNNGWVGADHPKDATIEWGTEMLQTTADYIADFLEELKKAPIDAAR